MSEERRRSERFWFFASAEITEPETQCFFKAHTNELCRHGCYMDMLNPLRSGTDLKVRITHEGETMEVSAHVVHSQPNIGMRLEFDAASSEMRLLDRWLSNLRC